MVTLARLSSITNGSNPGILTLLTSNYYTSYDRLSLRFQNLILLQCLLSNFYHFRIGQRILTKPSD